MLTKTEGLILYWAEGTKYLDEKHPSYQVSVTNTDPKLLKAFVDWLEKYYKVDRKKIRLRLHLWKDVPEKPAKIYWSEKLIIPIENFTKSWIKPKGGRNRRHPHGVCRAAISSKEIFYKIINAIEVL